MIKKKKWRTFCTCLCLILIGEVATRPVVIAMEMEPQNEENRLISRRPPARYGALQHDLPVEDPFDRFLTAMGQPELEEAAREIDGKLREKLRELAEIESRHSCLGYQRWACLDRIPEAILVYPLVNTKSVNPDLQIGERHMMQGHGLLVADPKALKALYSVNGFFDGFEIITRVGHIALYVLAGLQIISSHSVSDLLDRLFNGDSYGVRALVQLLADHETVRNVSGITALMLPLLVGCLTAYCYYQSIHKDTLLGFDAVFKTVEAASSSTERNSWWFDYSRWFVSGFFLIPHPLRYKLDSLVRHLKWDGRPMVVGQQSVFGTRKEQRELGFEFLRTFFKNRGGYTKIVAAYHLAHLANSPHFSELHLLSSLSRADFKALLEMKAKAFLTLSTWEYNVPPYAITRYIHHLLYDRYLQWWLGNGSSIENSIFPIFKLVKWVYYSFILMSVYDGIQKFRYCPHPQKGVTFTGTASWSTDFSEPCFEEYIELFNIIPGQPANTLMGSLGMSYLQNFDLSNFGSTLDLSNKALNGTQVAEIMDGFAKYQKHLIFTALDFGGNSLCSAADFDAFLPYLNWSYYAHIENIRLSNNKIGQDKKNGIYALVNGSHYLKKIKKLNLAGNQFDQLGKAESIALSLIFPALTEITTLNLSDNNMGLIEKNSLITIAKALGSLPSLTSLDLSANDIDRISNKGTIAIWKTLSSLTNLVTLDLSSNHIGSISDNGTIILGKSLAACHKLAFLDLSKNYIGRTNGDGTAVLGQSISSLTNLQFLSLATNFIGGVDEDSSVILGRGLTTCSNLRSLDLSYNALGYLNDTGINALSYSIRFLTKLTFLNLANIDLGYTGQNDTQLNAFRNIANSITNLHMLTSLYIQQLDPWPMSELITLRTFWNNHSLNSDLYTLHTIEDIKSYFTTFPWDVSHISLRGKLNAPGASIITYLFQVLRNFKYLRSLDLSNNQIAAFHTNRSDSDSDNDGAVAVRALGSSLATLTNLQFLDLSNNWMGCVGTAFASLGGRLSNLTKLQALNLSHNEIESDGNNGVRALGRSLLKLNKLHSLDLSSNYIGKTSDDSTVALGYGLSSCSDLQFLDLSRNQIGKHSDKGTIAIGSSLHSLTKLQSLQLSKNMLGHKSDLGTSVLGQALAESSGLSFLDLSDNYIGFSGENGTLSLARGIAALSNLTALNLAGNYIGQNGAEGVQILLTILPNLTKLQYINFAGMRGVSWTKAASALASFNDDRLYNACHSEVCFSMPMNKSYDVWIHPQTSAATSLKPWGGILDYFTWSFEGKSYWNHDSLLKLSSFKSYDSQESYFRSPEACFNFLVHTASYQSYLESTSFALPQLGEEVGASSSFPSIFSVQVPQATQAVLGAAMMLYAGQKVVSTLSQTAYRFTNWLWGFYPGCVKKQVSPNR